MVLAKRNAFAILALAVPSVLLALLAAGARSWMWQVWGGHHKNTTGLRARRSHFSENSFFAGLRGGGDEPVENLFWTGKTKRFTGAAVGNNREETTYPPTQTQTTQTGAPTQPLQRWWDAPGGVGSWERGQKQRKAFMEYKHSFPPHHKQALTTPSRVFPSYPAFCPYPSAKIRNSLEKLLPKRTQLLMEGTNSQSRQQARRAQVPGVLQLNQVHYRP